MPRAPASGSFVVHTHRFLTRRSSIHSHRLRQVAKYLNPSLTFHNNPPSALRPRHRNHHVISQLAVDSSGREHVLMTFYIHARPPKTSRNNDEESTYWERLISFTNMTTEELWSWTKSAYERASKSTRKAFLYLIGEDPGLAARNSSHPSPSSSSSSKLDDHGLRETRIGREESKGVLWSIAGLFAGLVSRRNEARAHAVDLIDEKWDEGEVHADLVKDDEGNFQWRYILIDVPSTSLRFCCRLW